MTTIYDHSWHLTPLYTGDNENTRLRVQTAFHQMGAHDELERRRKRARAAERIYGPTPSPKFFEFGFVNSYFQSRGD